MVLLAHGQREEYQFNDYQYFASTWRVITLDTAKDVIIIRPYMNINKLGSFDLKCGGKALTD